MCYSLNLNEGIGKFYLGFTSITSLRFVVKRRERKAVRIPKLSRSPCEATRTVPVPFLRLIASIASNNFIYVVRSTVSNRWVCTAPAGTRS